MAEEIWERVRRIREAHDVPRAVVARRLDISPESYAHYERGRTEFTASQIQQISRVLRVPAAYLLGEQSEEEFQDQQAAKYYNGIAPALQQTAKEMLRLLYEQSDREDAA